jgi:4-amino-4-deoxy-L-arabinose transferase-like glycosyltransferase/outer membrane protein assembly factor BamB
MGKHKWLLIIPISLVLIQLCHPSIASSVNATPTDEDWKMFRHNSNRGGYSSAKNVPDSVKPLWAFKTWKAVKSSPAVANGCLLIGSRDWRIYCLDSSNGRQIWNYSTRNEVNSSPAIYNGSVYVGSDDGYVYRVDLATGTLVWKSEIGGLVQSSPAIVEDKVYIGSGLHDVFCLNASDGTEIRRYTTLSRVRSSPAVVDGVVYVAADDFHVYAFNASSGSEIWRVHTGSVFSSPCIYEGSVYIGSNDGYVCCLNASTGAKIWAYQTGGSVFSSAAVAYGRVYIGSDDNNVYCLNISSGDKIWESQTGYWVRSSPAVADGKVYVGSEDFNIYCLDAFTGEIRWSYPTQSSIDSSPAIANGILCIGSSDYSVYAFSLCDSTDGSIPPPPVSSTPWTMVVFDGIALAVAVTTALAILWYVRTAQTNKPQNNIETKSNQKLRWLSLHADALCVSVILISSTAFFVNLGKGPLWVTDEQTYAQWAFHMFKTGDYLTPWSFGQLDFGIGKPPLFAWLMSLAYQIFGVTNFAARFWSAMFSALSLVVVFFLGKKLHNRHVGLLSAFVLGTFTTFYVFSTRAMTDVTLIFFILGSMYFLLLSCESEGTRRHAALAGLFFGLAFMTKQVEALLIPLILLAYFIAARRGLRYFFTKRFALFWQVGILVVSPWIIYMLLWFGPDFWNFHFVFQGAARTVSFIEGHTENYLYYFSYLVDKETQLWIILLPFAAGLCAFKAVVRRSKEDTLILIWMSIVIGFFTLAQTKLFWYILPAFPAFAIAIGNLLFQMLKKFPAILASPTLELQSKKPEGNTNTGSNRHQSLGNSLKQNYPILGILLGTALLSISLGPFSSWDSQLEFSAAKGVIQWGMPYIEYGTMINMQPLAFYITAPFLQIFGASYATSIAITTIFSLGCVFLTYKIGETAYGHRTGLTAAGLFALTPWLLIMSRTFLADVYCLFFSLLYLLIGIWAIKKDSLKLSLLAGTVFGMALLAKLFAVFMLFPLALFFLCNKSTRAKRSAVKITLFSLPAVFLQYAWYGVLSGRGLLSIFNHDDFAIYLPTGFEISPLYSTNFLIEVAGAFLVLGCFLSLLVSFLHRKQFPKTFFFDLTCFLTIVGIMGFNLVLVFYGNMMVPYINSIKYNFLTLPMLCLLGASVAKKSVMMKPTEEGSPKWRKLTFYLTWIGLYLILISMASNFLAVTYLTRHEWVSFEALGDLRYSFIRLSPFLSSNCVWGAQVLGFVLIQFSLVWANRARLQRLFSSL